MNDVPSQTVSDPSRSSGASVADRNKGDPASTEGVIRFACHACGEKLSVPQKYAGRKGACPSCGKINRVPDGSAPSLGSPVFTVPSYPSADALAGAVEAPEPAHTPYADRAAAPVPAPNIGADAAEGPERWTRMPVKIEPAKTDDDPSTTKGLLRFFVQGSDEENQWVLGHRKQWQVDRRGMSRRVKVAILLACGLALVGLVWGFFYLLLRLVIAVNS